VIHSPRPAGVLEATDNQATSSSYIAINTRPRMWKEGRGIKGLPADYRLLLLLVVVVVVLH
jgi:hypothetical protein